MPPLLIGTTLLFWGYQTGFLPEAVVMAVILESSHVIKARWEFSDDEFSRVWTFCSVLLLAAIIFAFKDNGGFSGLGELFQHPDFASERDAGNASTMTADALFRWLPMIFFLSSLPKHSARLVMCHWRLSPFICAAGSKKRENEARRFPHRGGLMRLIRILRFVCFPPEPGRKVIAFTTACAR